MSERVPEKFLESWAHFSCQRIFVSTILPVLSHWLYHQVFVQATTRGSSLFDVNLRHRAHLKFLQSRVSTNFAGGVTSIGSEGCWLHSFSRWWQIAGSQDLSDRIGQDVEETTKRETTQYSFARLYAFKVTKVSELSDVHVRACGLIGTLFGESRCLLLVLFHNGLIIHDMIHNSLENHRSSRVSAAYRLLVGQRRGFGWGPDAFSGLFLVFVVLSTIAL